MAWVPPSLAVTLRPASLSPDDALYGVLEHATRLLVAEVRIVPAGLPPGSVLLSPGCAAALDLSGSLAAAALGAAKHVHVPDLGTAWALSTPACTPLRLASLALALAPEPPTWVAPALAASHLHLVGCPLPSAGGGALMPPPAAQACLAALPSMPGPQRHVHPAQRPGAPPSALQSLDLASALSSWFAQPRLLCVGQVVGIHVPHGSGTPGDERKDTDTSALAAAPPLQLHQARRNVYEEHAGRGVIFFRVISLAAPGQGTLPSTSRVAPPHASTAPASTLPTPAALVVQGFSTLTLQSSDSGAAVPLAAAPCPRAPLAPPLLSWSGSANAAFRAVSGAPAAISTFVAPPACGKRTILAAAGALLGATVLELSGWEVVRSAASAAGSPSSALRRCGAVLQAHVQALVSKGQRCLLHVRHCEALFFAAAQSQPEWTAMLGHAPLLSDNATPAQAATARSWLAGCVWEEVLLPANSVCCPPHTQARAWGGAGQGQWQFFPDDTDDASTPEATGGVGGHETTAGSAHQPLVRMACSACHEGVFPTSAAPCTWVSSDGDILPLAGVRALVQASPLCDQPLPRSVLEQMTKFTPWEAWALLTQCSGNGVDASSALQAALPAALAASAGRQSTPSPLAPTCSAKPAWQAVLGAGSAGRGPPISGVRWADVGGCHEAKAQLQRLITLPVAAAAAGKALTHRMSGVLLHGPPGTGKTLLAKAVAGECGAAFISVKGPELLDKYIGESEANVRGVFARARAAAPCVVFFDELDALAPRRGAGADSGGVSDRVVAQLLTELDGISGLGGRGHKRRAEDATPPPLVFVLGATNRPDLLDAALLRPGRLDRQVFVGPLASTAEVLEVVAAQLTPLAAAQDVTAERLAALLPTPCTGADIRGVITAAGTRALHRTTAVLEGRLPRAAPNAAAHALAASLPQADITPTVTWEDMLAAVQSMDVPRAVPVSCSEQEPQRAELGSAAPATPPRSVHKA